MGMPDFHNRKYLRRVSIFVGACACLTLSLCCADLYSQVNTLHARLLLLEKQEKTLQENADAEHEDNDERLQALSRQVQMLKDQGKKELQTIWL